MQGRPCEAMLGAVPAARGPAAERIIGGRTKMTVGSGWGRRRISRQRGGGRSLLRLAIAALWCGVVAAERVALAAPEDVEAGRRIVVGLTEVKACAGCHGLLGEGKRDPLRPRLTGQSWFYLKKQLDDFASGARPSEIMQPIAQALTEAQREDAAYYYAEIRWAPYPPQPDGGDPALLQKAGALSAVGDPERGIEACVTCHDYGGTGLPPSFPYLTAQYAEYTERQLRLWKQGLRDNDPLDVMAEIAEQLSDEEIRGLGLYFARVRLPHDAINDLTPSDP
jgi:cytochrome c553